MRKRSATTVGALAIALMTPSAALAADIISSGNRSCPSTHQAWVQGESRGITYHRPPGGTSTYKGSTSGWKVYITRSTPGNGGGIWRIDVMDYGTWSAGLTNVASGCHPSPL